MTGAFRRGLALACAVAGAVFATGIGGALAACTDPPAPQVNWQRCVLDGLEFQKVDLTGARLRDASFFRADLSKANLTEIGGYRTKFVNAVLRDARLDGAELSAADFTKADLTGATLTEADLRRVRFFGAILRGADLTGARLTGADFTRANLSGATWVDGNRVCAEGSIGRCN